MGAIIVFAVAVMALFGGVVTAIFAVRELASTTDDAVKRSAVKRLAIAGGLTFLAILLFVAGNMF